MYDDRTTKSRGRRTFSYRCTIFSVKTLQDRLREFIEVRHGKKRGAQAAFAEAIGMSDSQVSDYVTGRREPGPVVLTKFASAGLNIHWLLTGEGEMEANPPSAGAMEPVDMEGLRRAEIRAKVARTVEELVDELLKERERKDDRHSA